MNVVSLTLREIAHRWKTSFLVASLVAAITATLTFFSVNNAGFQKEVSRNARDIGSNVVILPVDVDQFEYHNRGGYSDITMSDQLVQQLIEYKASLNHLIPMLERLGDCVYDGKKASARIVGISASIPMPGRPKSPMQKSIAADQIQLGHSLASRLGVDRDNKAEIKINGQSFKVSRVNRSNGTWQDAAVFMDLKTAQSLFKASEQISRIEAIECTSEQCELTGLKSDEVLTSELARITDRALLLRREKMADARSGIRVVSRQNLMLLSNILWTLLAVAIIALSSLNIFQRNTECGVLLAVGFGQWRIVSLFVLRAVILTACGAAIGVLLGAWSAQIGSRPLFELTGKKFSIDWYAATTIGATATLLASLSSCLPALFGALRSPAELIGKES